MRILLADHRCRIDNSLAAKENSLEQALREAGHQVHSIPRPTNSEFSEINYETLSNTTVPLLAKFRDAFRPILDEFIERFNPHLFHVQQVGVLGELVLETGLPYVQTVESTDLSAADQNAHLRDLWELSVENAGRILVANQSLADEIQRRSPDVAENIVVISELTEVGKAKPAPTLIAALTTIYEAVVRQRCGDIYP
jgi:D-ribose pyranose/furanose isomerase RbsD